MLKTRGLVVTIVLATLNVSSVRAAPPTTATAPASTATLSFTLGNTSHTCRFDEQIGGEAVIPTMVATTGVGTPGVFPTVTPKGPGYVNAAKLRRTMKTTTFSVGLAGIPALTVTRVALKPISVTMQQTAPPGTSAWASMTPGPTNYGEAVLSTLNAPPALKAWFDGTAAGAGLKKDLTITLTHQGGGASAESRTYIYRDCLPTSFLTTTVAPGQSRTVVTLRPTRVEIAGTGPLSGVFTWWSNQQPGSASSGPTSLKIDVTTYSKGFVQGYALSELDVSKPGATEEVTVALQGPIG